MLVFGRFEEPDEFAVKQRGTMAVAECPSRSKQGHDARRKFLVVDACVPFVRRLQKEQVFLYQVKAHHAATKSMGHWRAIQDKQCVVVGRNVAC